MFRTKEIKTKTLGEKLRNAREAMKMPLEQASKKTRIPIKYLEYLERGNYTNLPADVYIAAYLQKYAAILNLDLKKILEQFKTEKGITDNLKESSISNSPSRFKETLPAVTPKRLGLVLAIIAICLVFAYFWHQLSYLLYPPVIEITQPASDITVHKNFIEFTGRTEPDTYLTINGKEVYLDKEGNFSSIINLEIGLNIIKVEAKDRLGKINTVIRRIMVAE